MNYPRVRRRACFAAGSAHRGCNAATRAAAALAALGFRVKEMLGGYEYWEREGHPVER